MSAGDQLCLSEAWDSVCSGAPLAVHFRDARVRVPGGDAYPAEAHVTWSAETGPKLQVLGPPREVREHRISTAGTLRPIDLWHVFARHAPSLRMSAVRMIPEARWPPSSIPERPLGEERLIFRPAEVHFWQRQRSPLNLFVREGLIAVPTDLTFTNFTTREQTGVGGSSSRRTRDASEVVAGHGVRCILRSEGPTLLFASVSAPGRETLRRAANLVGLALSVATGVNATWIGWREESGAVRRLRLRGPVRLSPRLLAFGVLASPVGIGALDDLVRCTINTGLSKPDVVDRLQVVETTRLPVGVLMPAYLVLQATILEEVTRALADDLHIPVPSLAISKEVAQTVLKCLEDAGTGERERRRVEGMLTAAGIPRAKDRLHAIRAVAPALVQDDELEAWESLRNPSAHGALPSNQDSALANLCKVANVTNKCVLRLLGYSGPYLDYGQGMAQVRHFGAPSSDGSGTP